MHGRYHGLLMDQMQISIFMRHCARKVELLNVLSLDVTEFNMAIWFDFKRYIKSVVIVKVLYVSTWDSMRLL